LTARLQALGFATGAVIFIGLLAVFWVAPGHIAAGNELQTCNRLLGDPTAFNSDDRTIPVDRASGSPRLTVDRFTQIAACSWTDPERDSTTRFTYQLHALPIRIVVAALAALGLVSLLAGLRAALGPSRTGRDR
jgi:hypothetical protein